MGKGDISTMATVKLEKLEAISGDEYSVTFNFEGRRYVERYRIREFEGRELVTQTYREELNSAAAVNAPLISAAILAFHAANDPKRAPEPQVDAPDPEAVRRAREDREAARIKYIEEHSENEVADLIKKSYSGLPLAEREAWMASLTANERKQLRALVSDDQEEE
jgi:hypothetical protein